MLHDALVRDAVNLRRRAAAAASRRRFALARQLRDEDRVGLVVTDVIVIDGPRLVVERDDVALRVEAAADLERERGTLRVPRRFLLPHPLHAHRPSQLFRQERRLEPGIVGCRAAEAPAVRPSRRPGRGRGGCRGTARHRCAGRTTSCRSSRSSSDRWTDRPSRAQGRSTCGPGTARRIPPRPLSRRRRAPAAASPDGDGRRAEGRRRAAHVLEQIFRRRERRGRRPLPGGFQLTSGLDGLLFAFTDDGDVVALGDHLDEAGDAAHGGLVDADELRARKRRPDVARVHHARAA